jgi:hypothetical protein
MVVPALTLKIQVGVDHAVPVRDAVGAREVLNGP